MAWYDAQNMGSAFPLLDYGTQTIARNVNNALPNNRNTNRYSGLESGQQYFPDEEVVDETVTGVNYPNLGQPLYPPTIQPRVPEWISSEYRPAIPERTGFLSSITEPVTGGLKWLGEKFKRPDEKQAAYENIMGDKKGLGLWESQSGNYGGTGYNLQQTPS